MVETVETRYQDAMVAKETLNEKVHEGIGLLESILTDFEAKAYKMREQGFAGAAGTLMDEGKRVVDGGIVRARGVIDEAIKAAESLEEHIEAAIAHAREHGLLRYDQLPAPWQNNHRISKFKFLVNYREGWLMNSSQRIPVHILQIGMCEVHV